MPAEKIIQHQSFNQFTKKRQQSKQSNPSTSQFTLLESPHALTAILSAAIQAQVSHNDALPPATHEDMTVFHALEPPSISVADYVVRVQKYVFCSEACLVGAYHYVLRAIRADPKLALTSLSVHRMFITAIVIACKYFDDISYNLPYYSRVGGLPCRELANLELHMLKLLNFKLDISQSEFKDVENRLISLILKIEPTDEIVEQLVQKARYELECGQVNIQDPNIRNQLYQRSTTSSTFICAGEKVISTSPVSSYTDESDSPSSSGYSTTSSVSSSPEKCQEDEDLVERFSSVDVSGNETYHSQPIVVGC